VAGGPHIRSRPLGLKRRGARARFRTPRGRVRRPLPLRRRTRKPAQYYASPKLSKIPALKSHGDSSGFKGRAFGSRLTTVVTDPAILGWSLPGASPQLAKNT
jgi:hypothetical protein